MIIILVQADVQLNTPIDRNILCHQHNARNVTSWLSICDVFLVSQTFCGLNHINHFMCEFLVLLKLSCGDTQVIENIVSDTGVPLFLLPLCVILTFCMFILYSVSHIKSTVG
ncbi:hypothetical protein E2320_003402 [Naja naja]|nr:hypothetical protein E2320_003402 [Naja naja]